MNKQNPKRAKGVLTSGWLRATHLNLSEGLRRKKGRRARKTDIFPLLVHGESERRNKEEREAPTSLYDLRRSVGLFSSGQELKIICSTKATVGTESTRFRRGFK